MDVRDRIIEGAAQLFKIYGIKSVTMDTLANHLGISKRTIYEVFSDKKDLLIGVMQWMAAKQRTLVKRILDDSDNAVIAIFRLLESSRDHFQDISPVFQADLKKYYHLLEEQTKKGEIPDYRNNVHVIERGIKEKLFRRDINPDIVNRCLYSLGRSSMDYELYPFEEFTRQDVIKNIFINYLKGISTKEGIDLINSLEAKF
jgi:AcrR family transcriptional regulator